LIDLKYKQSEPYVYNIPHLEVGYLVALRDAGVAEIFGPGTNVIDAANAVLGQILGERRNH